MQPALPTICDLCEEALPCRQCSSGLQAVADVAAAIRAGYYTIGVAAGVESMTSNPMDWKAGINPRVADNKDAANCMLPMGEVLIVHGSFLRQ